MGGGLESRCVGRVYGADGGNIRTVHTTYTAALKTTTLPKFWKIVCCNSTYNAPDNGLMYPKRVELRIHQ